jgi:hypothetical protein
VFHSPPSELDDMDIGDLMKWHEQAVRIMKLLNSE